MVPAESIALPVGEIQGRSAHSDDLIAIAPIVRYDPKAGAGGGADKLWGTLLETYAAQNLAATLELDWSEARLAYWHVQGRDEVASSSQPATIVGLGRPRPLRAPSLSSVPRVVTSRPPCDNRVHLGSNRVLQDGRQGCGGHGHHEHAVGRLEGAEKLPLLLHDDVAVAQ